MPKYMINGTGFVSENLRTSSVLKEDIVLLLIKKATEFQGTQTIGILGKKALQKSLYFFNLKHDIFNFRWGDYGPISGEIQQIAKDLISNGNVTVTDVDTMKQGAVIQNMKFSDVTNVDFLETKFPLNIDQDLDEIVHFIAGRSPRDLELLASVHFWAQRQYSMFEEYTVEYILEKLTELKPDAGFTKSDVESAINTLKSHKYLV